MQAGKGGEETVADEEEGAGEACWSRHGQGGEGAEEARLGHADRFSLAEEASPRRPCVDVGHV